jgi:hypothetical protein
MRSGGSIWIFNLCQRLTRENQPRWIEPDMWSELNRAALAEPDFDMVMQIKTNTKRYRTQHPYPPPPPSPKHSFGTESMNSTARCSHAYL